MWKADNARHNAMRTDRAINVVICNKYTLFREGIKALLDHSSVRPGGHIEVAGEAPTAKDAIEMLDRLRPDVVLMDVALPDLTGPETIRRVKAIAPGVEILIVSLSDDKAMVSRCLQAGAAGYIRTNDLPTKLKNAIQAVYRRGAHAA
jgi:DNA-binding NarL/FixJ family response regulator